MFGMRNRSNRNNTRGQRLSRIQDRQPLVVRRQNRQDVALERVEVREPIVQQTEPTEVLTTPLITGKNQNILVMEITNAGATAQKAVLFDALGAVGRASGDTNGADITVRLTGQDYISFNKALETNRYQISEMVFDTIEAQKATLNNPVYIKTYDNGIGVANTVDKIIPSSYKSENQFNSAMYTVRRNIDLNSFKALVTEVNAGATLTITFRMS